MRTSHHQYITMLEFMETHGDLSRSSIGPRGRHYVQEKWKELINLLNSDATGDYRSDEKWRKVWSDWKNNTKKKYAKIAKNASGTGDGPALQLCLSDIESRVLKFTRVQAAVGMPIEEADCHQNQNDEEAHSQEATVPREGVEYTIDWHTPSTSTVAEPRSPITPRMNPPFGVEVRLSPSPPALDEHGKPPPNKKKKNDDVAQLFIESDRSAREYARERDRVNEHLERERIRQRDEELRLREFELRERIRQRDVELHLQAQWLELIQECMKLAKGYIERK